MKPRILAGLALAAPAAANQALIDLPADTWYEAPASQMQDVCPPRAAFPSIQGTGGCRMVINAWSGGAYDDVNHRMYVWGGGHNDYYGNEIYSFDLATLKWRLETQPSKASVVDQDPLPDGNPVSRHTYDGLAFFSHDSSFFAYGGSMAGGAGNRTFVSWRYRTGARQWQRLETTGTLPYRHLSCGYDRYTGTLYMRDHSNVFSFNSATRAWTKLRSWEHRYGEQRGAFDPTRRLLFTVGIGEFQLYSVAANADVSAQWQAPGGEALAASSAPGIDYDFKADALVGWNGGAPYIFDMKEKKWSRGSAKGAPAAQNNNGTHGRFRYVPEYNVFVLVNDVGQNVFFYKHKAGGPASNRISPPRQGRAPALPELDFAASDERPVWNLLARRVDGPGAPAAGAFVQDSRAYRYLKIR